MRIKIYAIARKILRIKKLLSPDDARVLVKQKLIEMGMQKHWQEPVLVIENLATYDVWMNNAARDALFVSISLTSGEVLGIYSPWLKKKR